MPYRYIMAVNQSQVDCIITAALEDDPEVEHQDLEGFIGKIPLLKGLCKLIRLHQLLH